MSRWGQDPKAAAATKGAKPNAQPAAPANAKVSISPTFYDKLFHTKVFFVAFLYSQFVLVVLWQKRISQKAARKIMLVKLTKGRNQTSGSRTPESKEWTGSNQTGSTKTGTTWSKNSWT
jgi:hypothetical protein